MKKLDRIIAGGIDEISQVNPEYIWNFKEQLSNSQNRHSIARD